jgi:hypothetical protein
MSASADPILVVAQLVLVAIQVYFTAVVMIMGFAVMLKGGDGAAMVARALLVAPLSRLAHASAHGLMALARLSAQASLRYVIDPLLLGIERFLRWLWNGPWR